MDKRGKIVISIITLFVVLVSVSSYFVLAAEANTKSYDASTRTVTIKNADTEIAKIRLNTPLVYNVIRGKDRLVAEFTIDNYADASNVFNNMEFYDIKNNMKAFSRDFSYKYKTYYNVEVPDYETSCKANGNILINGSVEKYDCTTSQVGTHIEQRVKWIDFNDKAILPKRNITLGIFTEVLPDESVEWIPTFFGTRITEWGVWNESLNNGLTHWFEADSTNSVFRNRINSSNNGSLTGAVATSGGTPDGVGYIHFDGTNDRVDFTNQLIEVSGTKEFTLVIRVNMTTTTASMAYVVSTSTNQFFIHRNSGDNEVGFLVSGAYLPVTSGAGLTNDGSKWKEIALMRNASGIYGFIDGVQNIQSVPYASSITNGINGLGEAAGLADMAGGIYKFAIWNRSLSYSEIQSVNNSYYVPPDTTPPDTTQPIITPSEPKSSDDLQCNATLTDEKQMNLTANWTWYKNNVTYLSGTTYNITNGTNSLITTLPAVNTTEGESWMCGVKPFDGTNYGEAKNSSAITILVSIVFNVTSGEDGSQITQLDNIACNNSWNSGSISSPFEFGFLPGSYECTISKTNWYSKTINFVANVDKTTNVKLSWKYSLTIEEHTWLEAIYNCLYSGDCSLYNLLLEVNQTIGKIWENTKPTDNSVITNETITNKVVDSTHNLTINYVVNIPIKARYSLGTYLPVRIGFWFMNEANTTCYNQGDKPTGVEEPYCQPLIIETLGPMGGSVNFTVKLHPELPAGNYSIKRIIDIDPNNVWINYGQETIGSFVMLEGLSNYGISVEKTGEIMPEKEGILQSIKSGITGAITGIGQLLSGWQIVAVLAIIGGILITFIISRTIIKLKKK